MGIDWGNTFNQDYSDTHVEYLKESRGGREGRTGCRTVLHALNSGSVHVIQRRSNQKTILGQLRCKA